MKCKVSVVIPVFDDADALPELLERLGRVSREKEYLLDIVLVDDGSRDKVWSELRGIVEKYHDFDLAVLRLDRNYGQHPATIQGLLVACGDFMVTMDADLQHPPEFIPALIDKLVKTGADVIYATGSSAHGMFRRLIGSARRILAGPAGSSLVKASSFRVISRSFFDSKVRKKAPRVINLDDYLSWEARKVSSIPAPHHPRRHNASSYTPGRLLVFALQSAWGTRHLSRAVGIVGAGLFLVGAAVFAVRGQEECLLPSILVGYGLALIVFGLLHRFSWLYRGSNRIRVIETIRTR